MSYFLEKFAESKNLPMPHPTKRRNSDQVSLTKAQRSVAKRRRIFNKVKDGLKRYGIGGALGLAGLGSLAYSLHRDRKRSK